MSEFKLPPIPEEAKLSSIIKRSTKPTDYSTAKMIYSAIIEILCQKHDNVWPCTWFPKSMITLTLKEKKLLTSWLEEVFSEYNLYFKVSTATESYYYLDNISLTPKKTS